MQHIVEFIASLVIAASAVALSHFGVTLRDQSDCPHMKATSVVQRLPVSLKRTHEHVQIVVTLV